MVIDQKGGIVIGWLLGIGAFIFLVIGLPLIFAALGLINLPFLGFEKKVQLNRGVITKTYDTEYCLQNYHWFKETLADIQQKQTQVTNFKQQMDQMKSEYTGAPNTWGFQAQQAYNEIASEETGVSNAISDESAQYNAKSQELDRKACMDLPLFVNP